MKAEEHPLSQKKDELPLGICMDCGCDNAERDLKIALLKAEQERNSLNEQLERGANQYMYATLKISELEETISSRENEIRDLKEDIAKLIDER